MSLVQACLCEGNTRFNLRGSAVKHLEASVSARAYRQSSFHRCGGPVSLMQASLYAGSPDKAVFTSEEVRCSTCRPV